MKTFIHELEQIEDSLNEIIDQNIETLKDKLSDLGQSIYDHTSEAMRLVNMINNTRSYIINIDFSNPIQISTIEYYNNVFNAFESAEYIATGIMNRGDGRIDINVKDCDDHDCPDIAYLNTDSIRKVIDAIRDPDSIWRIVNLNNDGDPDEYKYSELPKP